MILGKRVRENTLSFFLNPKNANPFSARCSFSPLYTIILLFTKT